MNLQSIIFFGSSKYFSALVLQKLLDARRYTLDAVITTPDRPVGRHLRLAPNPVKLLAQKNNIPVIESLDGIASLLATLGWETIPVGLVAAYGKIIPQNVLDQFGGQIYNLHPSLLPQYRGPSPLQRQILDGVTETGVTVIRLDARVDHGPIMAQKKAVIYPNDTWITLGNRLFSLGADTFLTFLLNPKHYTLTPQDDSLASYTKLLTRHDGFVPYSEFKAALDTKPYTLDPKLRALSPWPGVWTLAPSQKRLKLISLGPEIMVQPENRSPLPWSQFF